MGKINKLTKQGETVYPITVSDAVINPDTNRSVTQDLKRTLQGTGLDAFEDFSENESYVAGDKVWYDDTLYEFTADHAAGAWTGTDVNIISSISDTQQNIEAINTNVNVFNGQLEFSITDEYPYGVFYIRAGNLYNKGAIIKSVTEEIVVEVTESISIMTLCYDSTNDTFVVAHFYQLGTFVMMSVYRGLGIKTSIALDNIYNGKSIKCFYTELDFATSDIVQNLCGRGFFYGTVEYSTESNTNGIFTISSGNLYRNGIIIKQFTDETIVNVDFSAQSILLVYNTDTDSLEAVKEINDNCFLIAEVIGKNEIRQSCALYSVVNGITAKSIFEVTEIVDNTEERVTELESVVGEYLSGESNTKNNNVTAGTTAYLNFYDSGDFDVREGDVVVLSIEAVNVTTYSVVAYDLNSITSTVLSNAVPNQEYTITADVDWMFLRAVINASDIVADERITLHFLKKGEFEALQIDVENLEERVTELEDASGSANKLLNRYKPLYPINEEAILERPQSKFVAFKSFSPKIDYRGQVVFEGFSSYEVFDTSASIHFEERFLFVNKMASSPYTGVSYISSDLKTWTKYTHLTNFNASLLGETVNQSWGLTANDYGLLVFQTSYRDNDYYPVNVLFWSLDGGETFEPAINTLRAKVDVSKDELTEGTVVTIDGSQITVTGASDIQAYLKSMNASTSEELISMAQTYLADKCILSDNGNDTLRSLAGLLIALGYKVMLHDESLTVYYKEIGTTGNGQSFTVGSTTKTFSDAVDYSDKMSILNACCMDYQINDIYYRGTENLIEATDLVLTNSILYINGKWHLFGAYYNNTQCSILDLIIDDITNLPETSYEYKVVLSQTANTCTEPIATFDAVNDKIIVVFRNQGYGQTQKFVYSDDYGETWSSLIEIENSPTVHQANSAIFLVTNPQKARVDELFYNRPSSYTFNIYLALMYDRKVNAIYAATAEVSNNLEELQWSDWITLNRYNENLDRLGFGDLGMYFSDFSGYSSIGDFCYAPAHRGIALLYTGRSVIGTESTWTAYATIETC